MKLPCTPRCAARRRAAPRSLVKDRLGKTAEALEDIAASVAHYKSVHGADGSSLIAKALTSLGKTTEKLGNLAEAGQCYAEAARIFRLRAGQGPLLAGALAQLGKNLNARKLHLDGAIILHQAVLLEVEKDALNLNVVWELIEGIKQSMMGLISQGEADTSMPSPAAKLGIEACDVAIAKTPGVDEALASAGPLDSSVHGTTALLHMLKGEFAFAQHDYQPSFDALTAAKSMFRRIRGFEDCSLVHTCDQLLRAASKQIK